jgi:hypothetical protein
MKWILAPCLAQNLFCCGNCCDTLVKGILDPHQQWILRDCTIDTRIIRLHIGFFDLSGLNHQCVSFTTIVSENRSGIECQAQCLRKLAGWVPQKANLNAQSAFSLWEWPIESTHSAFAIRVEGLCPCLGAIFRSATRRKAIL